MPAMNAKAYDAEEKEKEDGYTLKKKSWKQHKRKHAM